MGALPRALHSDPFFTPLVAFTLMVFVLLYCPCMPTVAVFLHETRSSGWTAFFVFYTVVVAWCASFVVYQVGSLIGHGG